MSSVLTTEQSKDSVSIPLSGCHDQMEEDQDRRDDNETEIKTLVTTKAPVQQCTCTPANMHVHQPIHAYTIHALLCPN